MKPRNLFAELKRRNVIRMAGLYLVGAWLLVQVAGTVLPMFGAPDWLPRTIVILLGIGFVPVVVFSWVFELTPAGLKRDEDVTPEESIAPQTAHRMNRLIIAVLILALAYFGFDKFILTPRRESALVAATEKSVAARSSPESKTGVNPKSIAVLPFVNMSGDAGDEYLSDGMTEELLNVLAKVKGLRVPGRSSSFAFKGKNEEDIFRKVGEQLHVNTVLEGSVRKAGEKLRITAQLVNVADGYHLWSETYDRDIKDILAVQSDVAQRVVQALEVQLGVDEARALAKKPTENAEAYRLYLLGRYQAARVTQEGLTNATHYYEQALQVDPGFALAYCGLADTYAYIGGLIMPGKEAWARQKELAQKALALDPGLADAHLSLGTALAGTFHRREGENEIKRALELNPNLAMAYNLDAWLLAGFGRLDEAIATQKKALGLDPLNPLQTADYAWWLYFARRYDEAIAQVRSTLELDPNNAFAHSLWGWCLMGKGNTAAAIAEFEKAKTLDDLPWYDGNLGYAYAISGDRAKAEQVLTHLDDVAKQRYVLPQARAYVYLGLGEKNKALDWLEKYYDAQDFACWLLKVDPVYDSVRHEPRFQALLKKVGLDQ